MKLGSFKGCPQNVYRSYKYFDIDFCKNFARKFKTPRK